MKKTWILLTLCCVMAACKKNTVDFSYSPTQPRAGQSVLFTNLSSSGEDWAWAFGDGSTSTLRSPSHTYKKPGTYRVVLKVDNKNAWTATQELTVYDTIPTFVCEDSVFVIYQDYTFTANVYNPYNYGVSYEWFVTDSVVKKNDASIICYFTHPDELAEVSLRVVMNGDTTDITKSFYINDIETNSIVMRSATGDFRQRIFGDRASEPQADEEAFWLLDMEQDTVQVYNGYEFRLSELKTVFPAMQGFHIANRKIYYRAEGLWVANIDGTNQVQIDAQECAAMTLDMKDSRIYWANEDGVWYLPFIGSDNNRFVTKPQLLNDLNTVTIISADNELK